MANDPTQENGHVRLMDMNGNPVRVGDLVIVVLDKPIVAGYVVEVNEPSILDPSTRNQAKPGTVKIHGIVNMQFDPTTVNILRNVARLVHPQSEALVDSLAAKVARPAFVMPRSPIEDKKEGPKTEVSDPLPDPSSDGGNGN